jgi:hypothetical protein
MAREEDRPEPGLQLQVSRTIEYVAFNPIGGGKTQRVKAAAAAHTAVFGIHDDDAMIAKQPVKFG